MARSEGLEPPISSLGGRRFIQLIYERILCGDQPSLHTRGHLTFTALTIRRSAYEAPDAPGRYN